MKTSRRGERGFTLMEIIVVLAVIAALAAVLVPVVFRYLDDAKRAQAQADVQMIASSINQFFKDTGRYPLCSDGGLRVCDPDTADATLLTSNDACDGGASSCDTTKPTITGTGWVETRTDSLENQLVGNTPFGNSGSGYSTSGPRGWKGPYLEKTGFTDPWGRSYLVNIDAGEPGETSWVIVASSGADGTLGTNANTATTAPASPAGDDIIARVK